MDSYVAPEFLFKKRAILLGFVRPPKLSPFFKLLIDSADDIYTPKSVRGMCFRRVVWGNGPRLLYQHGLVHLRKITVNLLRTAVANIYNLGNGDPFSSIAKVKVLGERRPDMPRVSCLVRKCPLRVAMYSRGKEKSGRTIEQEVSLDK